MAMEANCADDLEAELEAKEEQEFQQLSLFLLSCCPWSFYIPCVLSCHLYHLDLYSLVYIVLLSFSGYSLQYMGMLP
jgi:hypothetical protein